MNKVAPWSLRIGALFAAGLVYAYHRRSNTRLVYGGSRSDSAAGAFDESLLPPLNNDVYVEALDDDIVEFVSLDSIDPDDPFDAIAPEDLGVQWLARATQTLGAPTSKGVEEFDELDPSGRPTDLPPPRV